MFKSRDDDKQEKVWSVGELCKAPYSEDGDLYKATIRKLTRKNGKVIATVHFDGYSVEDNEEIDVDCLQKLTKKKVSADVSIVEPPSFNDSIFRPLNGREETSWLNDKYSSLDEEDEDAPFLLDTPLQGNAVSRSKRKGVVAVGGATKKTQSKKRKGSNVKPSSTESCRTSSHKRDVCNSFRAEHHTTPKNNSHGTTRPEPYREPSPQPGPSREFVAKNRSTNLFSDDDDDDDDVDDNQDANDFRGYDEEELEKPRFSFTPSAAKIPYQLSDSSDAHMFQVPATINQYLRDYQRDGIKFLFGHYCQNQGAILADDMGLGKTVQVIGLLAALLSKQGNRIDVMKQRPKFIRQMSDAQSISDSGVPKHGPFLIIGPGSVLYNWIDELEVWGYFAVGKYHSSEKAQCLAYLKRDKYEVVVTTYETFRDNVRDLNQVSWDAVFVDEVHRIKGLKAQTTQALRQLKTKKRYGLTGTALQNSMEDLWGLLDWAQPGCLGSLFDFKEEFIHPIEKAQKHTSTKRELAYGRKKNQELAKIRSKMLIRRTKGLISDQLPQKDDNVVFCKLTDFQLSVYKAILAHPGIKFVLGMDDPCDCGSDVIQGRCHNKTPDGLSTRQLRFTFMHLLLKTANHVALLVPSPESDKRLSEFSKEVTEYIFQKFPQYFSDTRDAAFRTLSDPKYCGKMKVLKGLLSVFSKDHSKVLLFSYSTKVLDILEQYMMTTGYEYRRLDGSTSARKRMNIVREFNRDPYIFIFLISTKAGGLGLNLTGANRVIIFDPNWNPTHDLQAQDRAYRIGQRRNVQVYRLISTGSIEENMYLRQVYKQQLDSVAIGNTNAKRYFNAISGDSEQKGEIFGVKNMFQLHTEDKCLTLDILQRNSNIESGLVGYDLAKYVSPEPEPQLTRADNSSCEDEMSPEDAVTQDDSAKDLAEYFDLRENTTDEDDLDINEDVVIIPKKGKSIKQRRVKASSKVLNSGQFDSVDGDLGQRHNSSFSSVGAVFDQCGVVHVHQNKKVIGGSKAEDHMTKCAIQDVYELHQNSQAPAAFCDPYSDSTSSEENSPSVQTKRQGKKRKAVDHNTARVEVIGNTKFLIGQTPKAIRRKQFQKMAGSQSLVDFAQTVLAGDSKSRMKILKDFYTKDNLDCSQFFTEEQIKLTEKESSNKTGKTKTSKSKGTSKNQRAKDNPTLGISLFSDSESLGTKQLTKCSSTESNQSERLDVGRKITQTKTRPSVTTRTRTSRGHENSSKSIGGQRSSHKSNRALNTETEVISVHNKTFQLGEEEDKDMVDVIKKGNRAPHYTDLLEEIDVPATTRDNELQEDMEDRNNKTDLDMSVLDDIFLGGDSSKKITRKPPPGKKKDKKVIELLTLDTDVSASSTGREDSDLLNESTLKDDSFDCFSDPLKWKKRKRKVQEAPVDKLISEGDEDFFNLFQTGKLRKRDKLKTSHPVEIKDDDISVKSCDRTPSLF